MEMKDKIKYLRESQHLTLEDIGNAVGVGKSTVRKWETGDIANMRRDKIAKLAAALHTTPAYLMGWSDDPLGASTSTSGVKIPVLGDVAAGIPIEAVQNVIDFEEIDVALAATGEFFALRLKGNSMEPRMYEGDVVIVRKQDDANTGDTAVVLVNGDSATVKRIKKLDDGSLLLISNNPSYDPRHFSPAEIRDLPVRIIGKVVELRGKF